jgi:hypothetical protein
LGFPNEATTAYTATPTVAGILPVTVTVTNSVGTATATALITVNAPPPPPAVAPTISIPLASQSVQLGKPVTLSVTAGGTLPLVYTWRVAGVQVADAANTYTFTPTATTSVTVTVSNLALPAAASTAVITVTPDPPPPPVVIAPTITTGLINATVAVGEPVTFTVVAAGTAPLDYAWTENGVKITDTTATYAFTPQLADNNAVFIATVSNSAGTVTSSATLTVNAPVETSIVGKWTTLPYLMPVNPVHATLINDGRVLFVSGSGNCAPTQAGCPSGVLPNTAYTAALWTPTAGTFQIIDNMAWDMFCNGMGIFPDGKIFINGGTLAYSGGSAVKQMAAMMGPRAKVMVTDGGASTVIGHFTVTAENTPGHRMPAVVTTANDDEFLGSSNSDIFDPTTNTFTQVQTMVHGRWYPTITELNDGRLMTAAGQDENAEDNNTVEIYTEGTGWSPAIPPICDALGDECAAVVVNPDGTLTPGTIPGSPQFYPRMFLMPSGPYMGKVFHAGPEPQSYIFDPNAFNPTAKVAEQNWTYLTSTNYVGSTGDTTGGIRTYGSAVMLPLTPANGYNPTILTLGGDNPATNTTELIDMGSTNPQWAWGPTMSQPRIEMSAIMLPTGKVLAFAGSANDEDTTTASLNADLYDPASNTFSPAGVESYAHLYHNTALLLPDGTVFNAGSNPVGGQYETHMEIYQPAYLFNPDGTSATRPTITAVSPTTAVYGAKFTVTTPNAATITSVVLMKDGSDTHSFDMDQRSVGLAFTATGTSLTVTAPPNGYVAPPGYYMLFLVNSNGVPSVAKFIQIN